MTSRQGLSPGDEQAVAAKLNAILRAAGVDLHLAPEMLRIGKSKGTVLFREMPLLPASLLGQFKIQRPEDLDRAGGEAAFVKALVSAASAICSDASALRALEEALGGFGPLEVADPQTYPFAALQSVGYAEEEIRRHLAGCKAFILPQPKGAAICRLERGGASVEWRMPRDWCQSFRQKPQMVAYALHAADQLGLALPDALAETVQGKFSVLHREISLLLSGLHFDALKRESLVSRDTARKAAPWLEIARCGMDAGASLSVKPPRHLAADCPVCRFSALFDVVAGEFQGTGKPSEARSFHRAVREEAERRRKQRHLIQQFRETWDSVGRGLADDVGRAFAQSPWAWLPAVRKLLAQAREAESAWQAADAEVSGGRLKLGALALEADSPAAVREKLISQAALLAQRLASSGCRADGLYVPGAGAFSFAEIRAIIRAVAGHPNFGATTVAMLLTGSRNKKLSDLKLTRSRHYGALAGRRQADVSRAVEALADIGALEVEFKFRHDLPVLTAPAEAKEWAGRDEPVPERRPSKRESLDAALAAGDAGAVAALVKGDPALEFYLRAAAVLVPCGRAARMARKVLPR